MQRSRGGVASNSQVSRNSKSVTLHVMISPLSDDPSGHEVHFGEIALSAEFNEECFGYRNQARFGCRLVMLAKAPSVQRREGKEWRIQ